MANDSVKNEQPRTPGQRLAAAQAAKAARKAAKKGLQSEQLEDKALASAAVARDWLQENLKTILVSAGTVLVVAAVVLTWSGFSERRSGAAGTGLAQVLQTAEDEASTPEALVEAYREVGRAHPGSAAAAWARLGEGRALYEQGEWERSREAYEQALAGSDDETVQWLAIEGIAYGFEGETKYDEAIERLDALSAMGDSLSSIAAYQQGRLLLVQGKSEEARAKLKQGLAALDQDGAANLTFTRQQIESRLALIDPGGQPTPALDSRRLEQLIQRQQRTTPNPVP